MDFFDTGFSGNKRMHTLLRELFGDFARAPLELDRDTALELASLPYADNMDLLALGHMVRSLYGPKGTGTCAIVNAKSGKCPENCAFCAQSAHYRTGSPVYPLMDEEALVEKAREMASHGIGRFGMVTSGTTVSDRDLDVLCRAAERIRTECGMGLCASLGLLNREKATRLKEAGFYRYHHNLETARSFFSQICTTHDYDEDIETLRVAKEAGLSTCSLGIFGMGESWEQRIELLLLVRELEIESLPMNFLSPVRGTPLQDRQPLSHAEALRTVAMARLLNPARDIIICGGRLSTLGEEQGFVLASGASALMTGNYLTTRGFGYEEDDLLLEHLGSTRR